MNTQEKLLSIEADMARIKVKLSLELMDSKTYNFYLGQLKAEYTATKALMEELD